MKVELNSVPCSFGFADVPLGEVFETDQGKFFTDQGKFFKVKITHLGTDNFFGVCLSTFTLHGASEFTAPCKVIPSKLVSA